MPVFAATLPDAAPPFSPPLASAHADGLGILLDLALEATAATGAALLLPDDDGLRVLQSRGVNAPLAGDRIALDGTVAGEAWYRTRLITGAEVPTRVRQTGLWQEDRTVDVMAAPVAGVGRTVAVVVLYHRHLGHFRRGDATTLVRLASLAAGLWGAGAGAQPEAESRLGLEGRAAAHLAMFAAGQPLEADHWAEVARAAAHLLEVADVRVAALEGDELVCLAGIGRFATDLGRRRSRSFGFEGVALDSPDGLLAPEWTPEAGAAGPAGSSTWIRSLVVVPLRRLDQVMGVLTVAADTPGRFGPADRDTLQRFAVHAAASLSEAGLARVAARQGVDGRMATQLAAALAGAPDTPGLRRAVVEAIRSTFEADGCRLSEVVQGHAAVTATDGGHPALLAAPAPGPALLCGHAVQSDTHRCSLTSHPGHLMAATLGQVTGHAGCLQVVRVARSFSPQEEVLLRRLAEITEFALLSRLANVRVSRYADRIRSVAEVSATLHQSLRPGDAMSQAAEMLRRALGVGTVRIALVDEARQQLRFPVSRRGAATEDGLSRPLENGILEEVGRTGRTRFFPENAQAAVRKRGLTVIGAPRTLAVVPLRTRGTLAGVIAIEDEARDHAFEAEDVHIIEIVAQQLGVTLENLESLEEERRQRITAEWLRQMARTATDPGAHPGDVFELAADAAFQGIGGLAALVSAVRADGTNRIVAWRGQVAPAMAEPLRMDGSVAGWIREEHGAVFISADAAADTRLGAEARTCFGALALAAVPVWRENRIVAVVLLTRAAGATFAVAEIERMAQIADHAGAGYQTAMAGDALRKSEERYRRLFSSASDAILTLDQSGVVTSFNGAAERLWQVRAAGTVGARWETALAFEEPGLVAEQIQGAQAGESRALEIQVRRPDGERGTVAMTISPLVEGGQTTAVLVIVRDVTDQRRTQAQLLQAEKMSAIGQLVGGMAHEINNPLASILVNMELLLGDARDPAQLETLHAIRAETDRAAQIVRNLLTYVRGQGSERAVVDLRESVRGAVALRRNQLASEQIEVSMDLPAEPVLVWGNTINLQQVLMNLLVNAEHAIRQHRGRGQVRLGLAAQAGHATITVDDDGPGIPPEFLTRIFDPFYTTKPEGEGTGLGLSVSAGIVADHQGRISATERPGGGARFVVELPVRPPDAPAAHPEAPRAAVLPAGAARRGAVLLVDDEPDLRRSISKFLTRSGWSVDVADSGAEGLRLLEEGPYEAVLCDLRMPGMSGHEFYRRLQAEQSAAIERLIFMTGDVLSPEASRFLQEAGRPVLSKPFALQDLTDALAQVVGGA